MKTSNKRASEQVRNTWEFKGSHTYGEWAGVEAHTGYIVYSYGRHWPMFIKYDGIWYENSDKYSVSTSKQHTQLHPGCETVKKTVEEMKALRDEIEAGKAVLS
jgi:hypothetical protein